MPMKSAVSAITGTIALVLAMATGGPGVAWPAPAASRLPAGSGELGDRIASGERMFMEGTLPSGGALRGSVHGDVELVGGQAACGTCHRRSGMGSSEGPQVVPAVSGAVLFEPLRLPTSKPPLAPELRPAYTEATLRRAITAGIDANAEPMDPAMPRYTLSDREFAQLSAYLKTLSAAPSPGVTGRDIHFATIVADTVPAGTRKAMLDVMRAFFEQKNRETRYESKRAAHAPWHKAWLFQPYRKWVLHLWELTGPRETWPEQLAAQYRERPVFAVLGGVVPDSWRPVHAFCERTGLPCLFPTTDLPVVSEGDFYTLYLSKGMTLEAEAIARHLRDDGMAGRPLLQVYRSDDPRALAAAAALRAALGAQGRDLGVVRLEPSEVAARSWEDLLGEAGGTVVILWLPAADLQGLWTYLDTAGGPARVYLSTTLYRGDYGAVPVAAREQVYFVHPEELPGRLSRRLARSTGWLRVKRIYAPDAREVQANAFFAMKVAGDALQHIRGYFFRDYFIERVEDMMDNATYTSVYPRVSLAPGQRFAAKGAYITRVSATARGGLEPVTEWRTP